MGQEKTEIMVSWLFLKPRLVFNRRLMLVEECQHNGVAFVVFCGACEELPVAPVRDRCEGCVGLIPSAVL